jgi:deoxyinosine 3'endonuclease (endonuclease V)
MNFWTDFSFQDIILVDGQGIAHLGAWVWHPFGLWAGMPTIGCAKSRLCGEFGELILLDREDSRDISYFYLFLNIQASIMR